jgi:hypothetical protein
MLFRREKLPHTGGKNLFCYSSLLRSVSLRDTFLPNCRDLGRKLAAGRCGGIIARTIVLYELIHRLQSLIVLIKDL